MFRGGQPNPYDDIVAKTTDENLTSENWELILNLCDKVVDEGEQGARSVIAAVIKRLQHRNPNVQLYSLALAEALSKNCGLELHREIASRSFTQALERLVTDRTAHDKVKRKSLSLIAMWTEEFGKDPSLGIMEECYSNLKAKGYRVEEPSEPPPPQVDDEIRRREEEELQRVLEMSMHDKGGRANWDSYGNGNRSGYAAAGGANDAGPSSSKTAAPSSSAAGSAAQYGGRGYVSSIAGYAPARSPSPKAQTPTTSTAPGPTNTYNSLSQDGSSSQTSLPLSINSVQRVRALHSFEGTEQGELTFEKGDIIKVVDRNYKDWWRGQLRGRTGIFPVNYVELLPDPTPEDIAREAEQEAAVFAQAANIDKLLTMLRGLDPDRDNLADNEEIQELYRTSMALRPKVVKLIDKYSQKRAELVSMNETFVKARGMFDRMMEDSLARHSGLYDSRPPYQAPSRQDYRASTYGNAYDHQGFTNFPQPQPAYSVGSPVPGPQTYQAATSMYPNQQIPYTPHPYPSQQPTPAYGPGQYQPDVYNAPAAQPTPQSQHSQVPPQAYAQQQSQQPVQQIPAPAQQQAVAYQEPTQVQAQPQPQPQPQTEAQSQPQPQAQNQEAKDQPRVIAGAPPYVFDPSATYPDANAQAWAQYYAQGGTDLTGAVYFISVPGVKEQQSAAAPPQSQPEQGQPQPTQNAELQPAQAQSGSPTAERYPVQDPAAAQTQHQAQPMHDVNTTSLGYNGAAPQHPQSAAGSPTQMTMPSQQQGSFYGAQPQPQPQVHGQVQEQQAVPPAVSGYTYGGSPFPESGSGAGPGAEQNGSAAPSHPAAYGVNTQFAQMQGQFAVMGMNEPRSPTGVAPAVQQSV